MMICRKTLRCVGMSVGAEFSWEDVDWEGAAWLCPRSEGMPREGEKVAIERAGRAILHFTDEMQDCA